jgi:cytochrome P450 family 6
MGVPFEEPIFPFGNVYGVGDKYHLAEITEKLYNKLKVHKTPFIGYYSFLRPVVLVTELEFAKKVFLKDSAYFLDRGNFYNEEDGTTTTRYYTILNS